MPVTIDDPEDFIRNRIDTHWNLTMFSNKPIIGTTQKYPRVRPKDITHNFVRVYERPSNNNPVTMNRSHKTTRYFVSIKVDSLTEGTLYLVVTEVHRALNVDPAVSVESNNYYDYLEVMRTIYNINRRAKNFEATIDVILYAKGKILVYTN